MKVLLVLHASGDNYSVEAGLADNVRQFDHHGEFEHFPPPSNNPAIHKLAPDAVVEVTHMDADTFLALMRMAGKAAPAGLDLDLVARCDMHGSSVLPDKMDPVNQYMRGVSVLAKELGFPPKPSASPVDVSGIVQKMLQTPEEKFFKLGKESIQQQERDYRKTRRLGDGNVGLWVVDDYTSIDPSRPYDDGYVVVIIYRKSRKGMSIYVAPHANYTFGGKTVAGIQFFGHPKACGSDRLTEYTVEDAVRVYEEISEMVRKGKSAQYLLYLDATYRSVD